MFGDKLISMPLFSDQSNSLNSAAAALDTLWGKMTLRVRLVEAMTDPGDAHAQDLNDPSDSLT